MRWKSAREVCTSTPVESRLTVGRKRPCWRVTKATRVPTETIGAPAAEVSPAAQ